MSEITSQSAFRIAKNLSIPVSTDPLLYVPDREKAMLWEQVKENFTFENVDEAKVKEWGLKKGAISFQTYKKTLNKDYIKKGVEPDFSKHPKIRDHWDSFVQFKETSKEPVVNSNQHWQCPAEAILPSSWDRSGEKKRNKSAKEE